MRDGSLAGAEALARGIDEDGNIVMPDRFIETLEKKRRYPGTGFLYAG